MLNNQMIPQALFNAVLQDAVQRDPVTARRLALLRILWRERYLTRGQLIARIEMQLGKGCFGGKAWEDNFYRDMRFVRGAFARAGYDLRYSRKKGDQGYYLAGEPRLHEGDELRASAFARRRKVDFGQWIGKVYVHAPEDLILYKLIYYALSRQTKHIRDIGSMLKVLGEEIDEAYLDKWVEAKGLHPIWEEIKSNL